MIIILNAIDVRISFWNVASASRIHIHKDINYKVIVLHHLPMIGDNKGRKW